MKFRTKAVMRSNPDFELDTLLEPLTFYATASGEFNGQIGEIRARVGKIPIDLLIPFHPKGKRVTVASIGGFTVRLNPMSIHIKECKIEAGGVLGDKHGMRAKMRGRVGCKTEMNATGKLSGKTGKLHLQLGDEDDCDEHDHDDEHHQHHDHDEHDEHHQHHDHDEHDHHHQHDLDNDHKEESGMP